MPIPKSISSFKQMCSSKFSAAKAEFKEAIKQRHESIDESELSLASLAIDEGLYFIPYNGTT